MGDNCVCYDTCPLGKAWFGYNSIDKNQWVYLPCSGKGVCKTGGTCQCLGGYIGNNCEEHCSLKGADSLCCKSDEDCKMVSSGLKC